MLIQARRNYNESKKYDKEVIDGRRKLFFEAFKKNENVINQMNIQLTTSVIIATYNGMKYIEEQLDSIRLQARQPDEVIICDDVSLDGTFDFVNRYIQEHSLSNWKVVRNDTNMGWVNNFYKLFQLASGDIIFCADQDDVWRVNKIDLMTSIMEKNNSILVLGGNIVFFTDTDKIPKAYNIKEKPLDKFSIRKIPFNEKFYITHRPGCATCFRKSLLPYVNEMKFNAYAHDKLVWNLGSLLEGAYIVNEVVIHQRRHSESAMMLKKKENKRLEEMLVNKKIIQTCMEFISKRDIIDPSKLSTAKECYKFFEQRCVFLKSGNKRIAFQLLKFLKFYPKIKSYLADILHVLIKRTKPRL